MRDYWEKIDKQARAEGVVCFLQNAWSPLYAGGVWPRESWLRALRDSRSGKRLRLLVSNPGWCHNTTPIVGDRASSVVKPDPAHVLAILEDRRPKVVIACGKQAEAALLDALGSSPAGLIVVPHPAHRLLTNDLYVAAREELDHQREFWIRRRRIAFRQRKGHVEREIL